MGNSLAVRLPAALVQSLDLKEGDNIEIEATGARRFEVRRDMTREEAMEELRNARWILPADYKFNREELHDRSQRD